MYYQFNSLTGRITGSRNIQPYFPIGVQPLDRSEPPAVVFNNKHEKFASTSTSVCQASENAARGTQVKHGSVSPALLKKMELFQKPNDVPVFLKGGPFDKVLYRFTMLLCGIGLVQCAHYVYTNAVPKK